MHLVPRGLRAHCLVLWRLIVLFALKSTAANARNVGSFFHLTDVHLDVNYSSVGDLTRWCHAFANGRRGPHIGRFGNHNFRNVRIYCDSPWDLVRAAFEGMSSVLPDPDLILWTGDNLPHVPDSMYTTDDVLGQMRNLTDLLKDTFPGAPVYPVLGNHDYWQASQFTGHSNRVYRESAAMWSSFIGESATMAEGGFYRSELRQGLSLLGLNTNLYYQKNRLRLDDDPAGQMRWLAEELDKAHQEGRKVIIIGHIPPGSYERRANVSWFLPHYNEAFLSVLRRRPEPILHQFFGHNHLDSFRLLFAEGEGVESGAEPLASFLLAPSVCPGRSNNPSFRIFDYDRDTWELLDIRQYFLDLERANSEDAARWQLEYSFREAYGEGLIDRHSLHRIVRRLFGERELFQDFYARNSAQLHREECVDECERTMRCTLSHLDLPDYWACLAEETREEGEEEEVDPVGLLILVALASAATALLLRKR